MRMYTYIHLPNGCELWQALLSTTESNTVSTNQLALHEIKETNKYFCTSQYLINRVMKNTITEWNE